MATDTGTTGATKGADPTANPYLEGNFAPVFDEVTAFDLPITGSLPASLDGRYLRNGPNPIHADPATYHWFTGSGMVHGIRLRDGRPWPSTVPSSRAGPSPWSRLGRNPSSSTTS